MTVLISEHIQLYPHEEPGPQTKVLPHQPEVQRCGVEWISQVDTDAPPSSGIVSKTTEERPSSSTPSTHSKMTTSSPVSFEKGEDGWTEEKNKSKIDDKVDRKGEKTEGENEVAGSPSKQSKALPSWRCSFKGSAASGGQRGKIGGSAGDVSAAGGTNWLMNGLSSLRAHRRTTSSGEKMKDSTLSLKDSTLSLKETTLSLKDSQRDSDENFSPTSVSHRGFNQSHRLSAYDNVAPSSLSLPADSSSIWTSYEISLSEPEESYKATKSERQETSSAVMDGINTVESASEEDVTGTNGDFTNVQNQLKQELKKQKISYETSIRK